MNAYIEIAYLVVAYGLLIYTVVQFFLPEERKRMLASLSSWNPRLLLIGLIFVYGGINGLVLNVLRQESDPLLRWGWLIVNVFLVISGLWVSTAMIRNWFSRD